jgi:NAD(P)-dependent dehydrogenase (short-subunit alcohol dehydrogenase family)
VGRRAKEVEASAQLARDAGGEAIHFAADVARPADVEAMLAFAVQRFGRLDCAFNNAGILGPIKRAHEQREADVDDIVGINLKGTWLCMRAELAQFLKQRAPGAIVNTASTSAELPIPGSALYSATKAGVVALTRAAALEYAPDNIRINAILPGITRTPLIEGVIGGRDKTEKYLTNYSAFGRMASPEEIAEAAAWLCSDLASFVTGAALPVDAGQVAGERPPR